jgi:ERCC4-type nuclease
MVRRKKPTLIVDTREKTPWDFEADDDFEEVIYQKLDQGDYAIQGMEDICVIERKAGGDELLNNFFAGKERIIAEMVRLEPCRCPAIVIEQTLEEIINPESYYINRRKKNRKSKYMPPAVVLDNLTDIMITYGVHVIFGGQDAQKIAKRIMMRAWTLHNQKKL